MRAAVGACAQNGEYLCDVAEGEGLAYGQHEVRRDQEQVGPWCPRASAHTCVQDNGSQRF